MTKPLKEEVFEMKDADAITLVDNFVLSSVRPLR